jgi:hypothetical protein
MALKVFLNKASHPKHDSHAYNTFSFCPALTERFFFLENIKTLLALSVQSANVGQRNILWDGKEGASLYCVALLLTKDVRKEGFI